MECKNEAKLKEWVRALMFLKNEAVKGTKPVVFTK